MLRVDFGGCGRGGAWTTVNIDGNGAAHMPPDIVADITAEADQLRDWFDLRSIDEAQCIATFEHIIAHNQFETLVYWRTLLKSNAKLTIMVPDVRWLASDWLSGRIDTKMFMDCVFSPPEWTRKAFGELHRFGFDATSLIELMRSAGYQNVRHVEEGTQATFFVGSYPVPNLWVEGFA